MMRLLDEMVEHGMNLISIMMQSYSIYDPIHDGYSWPVRNGKLQAYRDENAMNSDPNTEFLSNIIKEASKRNIEVELFLNYGIWNHQRIKEDYPNSSIQVGRKGEKEGWVHCPDSPGAWQQGLDEVEDLLSFYDDANIKRFAFERLGYKSSRHCHCGFTEQKFVDSGATNFDLWKQNRISLLLGKYVDFIRSVRPDIKIGLHSQGKSSWGHDPKRFRAVGIDYVLPHTIQFKTSKRRLYKMLDHLHPNDCILHFDARNTAPRDYPIWIKTPRIIRRVLRRINKYKENRGDHIKGFLFFNEPMVSRDNKSAIYEFADKYA